MAKKVAIIGAGPGGLSVARALLAEENPGFTIRIFEKQETYGGLWYYVPGEGPMYRSLDTNVPRRLMSFVGRPFPDAEQQYLTRTEVEHYVQELGEELEADERVTTTFNALVESVDKNDAGNWVLRYNGNEEYESDFVLIASGHYHFELWPDIPGLRGNPIALHSHDYDNPDAFREKRVLIIGNATSGVDLSLQILSETAPITISRRTEHPIDAVFDEVDPNAVNWKPTIDKIDGPVVKFSDGTEGEFDHIVVCTGYTYDFPYLEKYSEKSKLPILHPTRARILNFYRHTFYSGDPTLATVGMNRYMVPFPTFDSQGAVIARVWNNRLTLPPLDERIEYENKVLSEKGDGAEFHGLPKDEDLEFMAELWDWAEEAPGGFTAERWSDEKIELRRDTQTQMGLYAASKIEEAKQLRTRRPHKLLERSPELRISTPEVSQPGTTQAAA